MISYECDRSGHKALRWIAAVLVFTLAACSHIQHVEKCVPGTESSRGQLSIGYSLLYEEADGIPKLHWLLMFKSKSEDTSAVIHGLMSYYQHLAETMRGLPERFPGVRIDMQPMSDIQSATRKAIGKDFAKDVAPLVGKSGIAFERETLLMLHDSLNEQRHLVGVMLEREKDAALRQFLQTTQTQLDDHYQKIGTLLNDRYFTH